MLRDQVGDINSRFDALFNSGFRYAADFKDAFNQRGVSQRGGHVGVCQGTVDGVESSRALVRKFRVGIQTSRNARLDSRA